MKLLFLSLALSALSNSTPASAEDERLFAIPPIGFGTWRMPANTSTTSAVVSAFEAGYRHIDCATAYSNEDFVGPGIKQGAEAVGAKRGEYWVTSKLFNSDHGGRTKVEEALDRTLSDLQTGYLDLWLMHWPVAFSDSSERKLEYMETWKAMVEIMEETEKVRFVGVSNFSPKQVEDVMEVHKPYAHQMEIHPYLPQRKFLEWHRKHGIEVTAYSPLGNTNPTYSDPDRPGSPGREVPPLLKNDLVKKIAKKNRCTPAQVVLKWGMLRDTSVAVKSMHDDWIRENWESLGCNLQDEDRKTLEEGLDVVRFNDLSKEWGIELFEGLQGKKQEAVGGDGEGLLGKMRKMLKEASRRYLGDEL